jgi:xanthine dehydrogenase small subunit
MGFAARATLSLTMEITLRSTDNMTTPIRFLRRGETVTLANVPPSRTLLEVLREDLCSTGTKEGCGEGDCGACTVVLGESCGDTLTYRAVNSCIRLAHSVNGMALWTAEDIAMQVTGTEPAESGGQHLHPVQSAMVQCHASQCGFCTPGFVMSLFAMYQNHTCKGRAISRELAQQELSGNLCRCTGYRPILDAAQMLDTLPLAKLNEASLLLKLKLLAPEYIGLEPDLIGNLAYQSPLSLPSLLATRAAHPSAQIVAGTTDAGLWVTKQHREFEHIIDVTQVHELRRIEDYPHHIAIGAAVTLNDAFNALIKDRPQLHAFATRFAGLSIRNSGTLGGNVANGSPIGDSMPLLIAQGANVVLMSVRGAREFALEDFYTGYRKNLLRPDEVLAWIKVPKPAPNEFLRVYKISKRFDDDISAICLGLKLELENENITKLSIGVGGVAAMPVRALKTEAACADKNWSKATINCAKSVLTAEFSPISDMRASSAYRSQVLGNLLERFWLESQGVTQINLESFVLGDKE